MLIKKLIQDESGMTTVEYAVGTVAAASLGGILLKMLSSTEIQTLIWKVIERAFSSIFGF
jgi:Flp pilus assembly pilin Flp